MSEHMHYVYGTDGKPIGTVDKRECRRDRDEDRRNHRQKPRAHRPSEHGDNYHSASTTKRVSFAQDRQRHPGDDHHPESATQRASFSQGQGHQVHHGGEGRRHHSPRSPSQESRTPNPSNKESSYITERYRGIPKSNRPVNPKNLTYAKSPPPPESRASNPRPNKWDHPELPPSNEEITWEIEDGESGASEGQSAAYKSQLMLVHRPKLQELNTPLENARGNLSTIKKEEAHRDDVKKALRKKKALKEKEALRKAFMEEEALREQEALEEEERKRAKERRHRRRY
ncbi:hypothetical protein BCON_0046g00410 [Botryotinia convoluta]|uniref:Uncharacterized protein n=1 Tax=Botryotinia convoluta TaxID=54673 RepID=A0A4Z1IRG6_9HELO|nr:hypothetical protein BCON_0046g00410 [Botryotinia convoluta]